MMQNRRFLSLAALALAVVLAVPVVAGAEMLAESKPHPEVAKQLKEFKSKAGDLRREADQLNSFSNNRQLSWQSHAYQQSETREHINQLGRMLAQLENQKAQASETQRIAIEQARPHLAAAALNLTQAIEMLNERHSHIGQADYIEALRDLYAHSDSLCQKLDAILDYENSKLRFESLNLQPASSDAS